VKEKQTKKPVGTKVKKEESKTDRDLTPEDITRLQAQIRKEQEAKAKSYQKTNLIDWGDSESNDLNDFFAKEKKSEPGKKKPLGEDYFNTDYF
jgi:hypothetical protein